jgi:8-oxo-dGTP diphosphatase
MKQVTAAVIEKDGKILLAQRKAGDALAGKWEFPGGKLEPGETPQACLRRELNEEFGVDTEIGAFVCSSEFEYKHNHIELLVYRARHLGGEFELRDHSAIAWVTPAELDTYDLASADIPVVAALRDKKPAVCAWTAARENKDHWYDGAVYDLFVSPLLEGFYGKVAELVPAGSRVLDIGCGTGRLCFKLADKCSHVAGVDLSLRNIEAARRRLAAAPDGKINFYHGDAAAALPAEGRFDFAVMTLMLHEVSPDERLCLLERAAQAADALIVGDHLAPAGLFWGAATGALEFAAGREHYANYRDFMRGGGLRGLARTAGFAVKREVAAPPFHLAVLSH